MILQKKIWIIVFIIILSIIIVIIKPLKIIKKIEIEKEVVSFLNTGKIVKWIDEDDIDDLNFAMDSDVNSYNIDDFVKHFIDYIDKCILIKLNKLDKTSIKGLLIKGNYKNLTITFDNRYLDSILSRIDDDDVKIYNSGLLEKDLIKQLEKVIEHRSNDMYQEWYITGNSNQRIELPYNLYIDYTPNDKVNHNDIEEVLSCNITESLNNLDNIKNNGGDIKCTLVYRNNKNEINQLSRVLLVNNVDNKLKYSTRVFMQNLLYTQNNNPTMHIGQHDYDKEREEWAREVDEMERLRHEDDGNEVVEEDWTMIPEFEKYANDVSLCLRKHETGKSSVNIVLLKRVIEDGKLKMIARDYILPYEDVTTKEEALERYLTDEEHFKADEEWLKDGNIDYKGD